MTWVAVGAAAVTGASSIYSANKAAGAQKSASNSAIEEQRRQFDALQANQQPYMQAGQNSLAALSAANGGDYSGFMNSPDYQYAKGEMQYGLDHGAAARGSLYSGGSQLDLMQHMNGLASQNLGAWRGSQMGLIGMGQAGAANVGAAGMGMAGNIGNAYNNTANAQGTAYGAQGTAFGNLAGAALGAWGGSGGGSSSYGGGSSAGSFGLPAPVAPYSATNYGSGGKYF